VAARYYPEGQYLIGPALYPLFQTIVWIVIAAVLGSQALAWAVAYLMAGETVNPLAAVGSLVSSIPAALGWVVVVFIVLQRLEVRPEEASEAWDPVKLPQINPEAEVKRGEILFGLLFEIFLLAVLIFFRGHIGAYQFPGGPFFGNPVLEQYLVWVCLSLLVSIAMDIYLIWQGRWNTINRLLQLGSDLFSLLVLALLVQGHTAWLQAHGVTNFTDAMGKLTENIFANGQIVTMWAFWMAFSVALIVTVIETVGTTIRLARSGWEKLTTVKSMTIAK
jgi:hypothetical protein